MAKVDVKTRRQQIKELLETTHLIHLNKTELARQYGVHEATIRFDIKQILKESKPEDAKVIIKKFCYVFFV